ncbi:hypothetical protein ARSEF4850_010000 [Beauveria asiatica]
MPSIISCLVAGLAVADRAASLSYTLSKTYDASNFLEEFEFQTSGIRPGHDFSAYVRNETDAIKKGLVSVQGGKIYLGVDSKNEVYSSESGRATLRVQSKNSFKQGLVITSGTLGTGQYPENGGINMYEGWNLYPVKKVRLFTGPENTNSCVEDRFHHLDLPGANFCETIIGYDNDGFLTQLCQFEYIQNKIWGSSEGGIQALEWTSDAIKLYNWPIDAAPSNIKSSNPDTSSWGTPSAQFTKPGCDTQKAFSTQTLQFSLSFCQSLVQTLWSRTLADSKGGPTCRALTGEYFCDGYIRNKPEAFKNFYFEVEDIRIFDQDTQNTQGQLSLDGNGPLFTFSYTTSQPSSENWIGIWPEGNTQAPTWGSTTWDYAKDSSGSLQITPSSSMKAGKYKAYLLSSDRTVLAFLPSFDYSPSFDDSPTSDSVAFSVKTHYKTNCAGSVNNNVDIMPGNGVCVNTDCAVGSLEIPSVGSCPDGEIRISYWQNADCKGDWYGYGYGSRGTCRGLWSNGWGFKSLWVSCAKQSEDCVSRGECSINKVPSHLICSL